MRILIVSSYLPYPLHNGGHVRLYNIIKELAKRHKITLVCEKRAHQTKQDVQEVAKFCEEVITVNRKKQWSMGNVAKAGISLYPFLLVGHTLPEMKKKIVDVLREKQFDIIHIETFYVYQNIPKTYLPKVLVEHNIEYEVYERYAKQAKPVLRPLLLADIAKIKYWERKFWQQATKVVAVSEKDKEKMLPLESMLVPNGVNLASFLFKKSQLKQSRREKRILFMGDFKWIQNKKAGEWILKEIWPKIEIRNKNKESKDSIKLWIVGKNIPDNLKQYASPSILFDENAPDETAKIYEKSFLLLAPITVGGGSSYKILESMASGVPIVTTPLGAQGVGAKHKKEVYIGQKTEELAEGIQLLLESPDFYEKIAKEARSLIEKKYSWSEITKTLEKVYEQALL